MRPDFEGLIPDRDQLFFLEDSIVDKLWNEILNKCETKSWKIWIKKKSASHRQKCCDVLSKCNCWVRRQDL